MTKGELLMSCSSADAFCSLNPCSPAVNKGVAIRIASVKYYPLLTNTIGTQPQYLLAQEQYTFLKDIRGRARASGFVNSNVASMSDIVDTGSYEFQFPVCNLTFPNEHLARKLTVIDR